MASWRVTLLVLGLSAACSSGSPAVDASLPDGAIPIHCDVVDQTCPTGQRCDFTCDQNGQLVIACTTEPANAAKAGESCSGRATGATSSCMRGTGCFGSSMKGPTCYRYCRTGSECPMGTTCDTSTPFRAVCPKSSGNLPVGLCR
jgi:hypothetical protein